MTINHNIVSTWQSNQFQFINSSSSSKLNSGNLSWRSKTGNVKSVTSVWAVSANCTGPRLSPAAPARGRGREESLRPLSPGVWLVSSWGPWGGASTAAAPGISRGTTSGWDGSTTSMGSAACRLAWLSSFHLDEKVSEQVGHISLTGHSLLQCLFIKVTFFRRLPHPLSHKQGNKSGLLRRMMSALLRDQNNQVWQRGGLLPSTPLLLVTLQIVASSKGLATHVTFLWDFLIVGPEVSMNVIRLEPFQAVRTNTDGCVNWETLLQ